MSKAKVLDILEEMLKEDGMYKHKPLVVVAEEIVRVCGVLDKEKLRDFSLRLIEIYGEDNNFSMKQVVDALEELIGKVSLK